MNFGRRRARLELLEDRLLLAFDPTGMEQEMLEHVNRMRMAPQDELSVLFTSLDSYWPLSPDPDVNEAIAWFLDPTSLEIQTEWSSLVPAAPVAWHESLYDSATGHSQEMILQNAQSHQLPGEESLGARVVAAGYTSYTNVGENVFAYTKSVFHGHSAFAIDWGVETRGHRDILMSSDFREIGISIIPSTPVEEGDVGPLVITQDYGDRWSFTFGDPYLLGVVYEDVNSNGRFDAGEGFGGVDIEVTGGSGTFTTTTMTAGGYQVQVPDGTYTVTATGGGLSRPLQAVNVSVAGSNVKADLQPGVNDPVQFPPVANTDAYSVDKSSSLVVSAPGVLDNDTDQESDPLSAVLTSGPSHGTLGLNADGSFTYTPAPGYHGPDSFAYRANDGQANSNNAQVDLRIVDPVGGVAFVERPDQDPSAGDLWYRLQTTRQGVLSLEAVFAEASGSAGLTLYDGNETPLAASSLFNGRQRIDWNVNAAETFLVKLSGSNSDVDLTMANLVQVSPDGSQATVYGTAGDDTFEAAGSPNVLTINGVRYESGLVTTVEFFGGGGSDTAILTGSAGDETATVYPASATLAGTGYSAEISDVASVTIDGGGGNDSVDFYDSPGNDLFVAAPDFGRLTGSGFSAQAAAFQEVSAYATGGGRDVARMYDSPGDDIFYSTPVETTMYQAGGASPYLNRVKYFEEVHGFTPAGGHDVSLLFDSAGDDTFRARPAEGAMYGSTGGGVLGDREYFNRVKQSDEIRADASGGGNDEATLFDSPGDDTFLGSPVESAMYGAGYYNEARYFEQVYADASTGGNDQARLFDSNQVDLFEAATDWARLSNVSLNFLYELLAFDQVTATATTDGDTKDVTEPLDFLLYLGGPWQDP